MKKDQVSHNSLKNSPIKLSKCKKNCEDKLKNNIDFSDKKIDKNEKFSNEFFDKKIIKPSELSFPKDKENNTKKVFSSYIIDNSNPKTQYLMFKNLREKKSLLKDEIDVFEKRNYQIKKYFRKKRL